MSNSVPGDDVLIIRNGLTVVEQVAWERLRAAEAELAAARWAVIETTNRESANRRDSQPALATGDMASPAR
jgi:hypothetical protein